MLGPDRFSPKPAIPRNTPIINGQGCQKSTATMMHTTVVPKIHFAGQEQTRQEDVIRRFAVQLKAFSSTTSKV
jgi:hypothetical protein